MIDKFLSITHVRAFQLEHRDCCSLLLIGLLAVAEAYSLLLRSALELCCLRQAAADFELSSYTAVEMQRSRRKPYKNKSDNKNKSIFILTLYPISEYPCDLLRCSTCSTLAGAFVTTVGQVRCQERLQVRKSYL